MQIRRTTLTLTNPCSTLVVTTGLLLCSAVGCASGSNPPKDVVALIDQQPRTVGQLERYFELNLLLDREDRPDQSELNKVKSRLFDNFIEEILLVGEAERLGMEVSDREIEAYLGVGREEDESAITESRWHEAQRRLMIQKLQAMISRDQPPITEEEVDSYLDRNREEMAPEKRLRLRTLRLETEELAQRIHGEIKKKRMTFDEAIAAHADTPEQGHPLEIAWESLAPTQRVALEPLRDGQVSRPVKLEGEVYLIQVQSWLKDSRALEAQLRRQARQQIAAGRRQEAYDGLLRQLRSRTKIDLRLASLPFEYVPAENG